MLKSCLNGIRVTDFRVINVVRSVGTITLVKSLSRRQERQKHSCSKMSFNLISFASSIKKRRGRERETETHCETSDRKNSKSRQLMYVAKAVVHQMTLTHPSYPCHPYVTMGDCLPSSGQTTMPLTTVSPSVLSSSPLVSL